ASCAALCAALLASTGPAEACVGSPPECSQKGPGEGCESNLGFGACQPYGCAERPAYHCAPFDVCTAELGSLREACDDATSGEACSPTIGKQPPTELDGGIRRTGNGKC